MQTKVINNADNYILHVYKKRNEEETIKVIKEQHGKPKNDYGLLSYMAGKI